MTRNAYILHLGNLKQRRPYPKKQFNKVRDKSQSNTRIDTRQTQIRDKLGQIKDKLGKS